MSTATLPFYIWSGDENNDYFSKEEIEIFNPGSKNFRTASEIFRVLKKKKDFTELSELQDSISIIQKAIDHLKAFYNHRNKRYKQAKLEELMKNQLNDANGLYVTNVSMQQFDPLVKPDNFKKGINPHEISVTFIKYYIGDNIETLDSKTFNDEFVHRNVDTNSYYCLLPDAVNLYDTFQQLVEQKNKLAFARENKIQAPIYTTPKDIISLYLNVNFGTDKGVYQRMAIEPLGFMFNNIENDILVFLKNTQMNFSSDNLSSNQDSVNILDKFNERLNLANINKTRGNRLYLGDPFHYRVVNFALTNLTFLIYILKNEQNNSSPSPVTNTTSKIKKLHTRINRSPNSNNKELLQQFMLFKKIYLALAARVIDPSPEKDETTLIFNFLVVH